MKKTIILIAIFLSSFFNINAQVKLFDVEFKDCKVYIKQTNSKEIWSIKPVNGFWYDGNAVIPTYNFASGNTSRSIFYNQFNSVKFEGVSYTISTAATLGDTIKNYLKYCVDSSSTMPPDTSANAILRAIKDSIAGTNTILRDTLNTRTRILNDSLKIYGNVNVTNDSINVHVLNSQPDTSNLEYLRKIYLQDSVEYAKCDTFHLDTLDVRISNDSLKIFGNVNISNDSLKIFGNTTILNDSINVHVLNNIADTSNAYLIQKVVDSISATNVILRDTLNVRVAECCKDTSNAHLITQTNVLLDSLIALENLCDTFHFDTLKVNVVNDSINVHVLNPSSGVPYLTDVFFKKFDGLLDDNKDEIIIDNSMLANKKYNAIKITNDSEKEDIGYRHYKGSLQEPVILWHEITLEDDVNGIYQVWKTTEPGVSVLNFGNAQILSVTTRAVDQHYTDLQNNGNVLESKAFSTMTTGNFGRSVFFSIEFLYEKTR